MASAACGCSCVFGGCRAEGWGRLGGKRSTGWALTRRQLALFSGTPGSLSRPRDSALRGDETPKATGVEAVRHRGDGAGRGGLLWTRPLPPKSPQGERELCPLGEARSLGWRPLHEFRTEARVRPSGSSLSRGQTAVAGREAGGAGRGGRCGDGGAKNPRGLGEPIPLPGRAEAWLRGTRERLWGWPAPEASGG